MDKFKNIIKIENKKTQMVLPLSVPAGVTRDEVVDQIGAAKKSIVEGRDPSEKLFKTKTWERWASRRANLVTVATK